MMVSYIQSNYEGFGSGLVVPGTGIALHDRGGLFHPGTGPSQRGSRGQAPYHTIIPAFLTRAGRPVGPFGVMGGYMPAAGDMSRWLQARWITSFIPRRRSMRPAGGSYSGLEVGFEAEIPAYIRQRLAARGHSGQVLKRGGFRQGQNHLATRRRRICRRQR